MPGAEGHGHFRIRGVIEGDGWGPVLHACWRRPGVPDRDKVVEILDPDRVPADALARRLAAQLPRPAGLVAHGGLVVERIVSVEERLALVRPQVDGVDLATILASDPLTARVALSIAGRVARTLAAAHDRPRGGARAHGALTPAHVLITPAGEVRVTGFGKAAARFDVEGPVSAVPAAAGAGGTGAVGGHAGAGAGGGPGVGPVVSTATEALASMPPEGLPGGPSPAADVYALGVLVLTALDCRLDPGPVESYGAHLRRLDAVLHPLAGRLHGELALLPDLLAVLLSYDPAKRPSAQDCADALEALAEHDDGPGLARWAAAAVPPLVAARFAEERAAAVALGVADQELAVAPFPPTEGRSSSGGLRTRLPEVVWDEDALEATWDSFTMPTEPVVGASEPDPPVRLASDAIPPVRPVAAPTEAAARRPAGSRTASSAARPPAATGSTAERGADPDGGMRAEAGGGTTGAAESGSVMSGTVMSGTVMSGTVMSGTVMSGTVSSGTVSSDSGASGPAAPAVPAGQRRALLALFVVVLLGGGALGGVLAWVRDRRAAPRPADRQISDLRLAADLEDLVDGVVVDGDDGAVGAKGEGAPRPPAPTTAPATVASGDGAPVSVGLSGDADAVYLVSDSRRYKLPGPVPGGAWHIEASFDGGAPTRQGSLLVTPGDSLVIACSAADRRCVVR